MERVSVQSNSQRDCGAVETAMAVGLAATGPKAWGTTIYLEAHHPDLLAIKDMTSIWKEALCFLDLADVGMTAMCLGDGHCGH